ncbi:MAG TPA: threonine synthase [Gemmatimonadaceae bacterium]|nr:threonine synthase [Gemmatimonadaceae bacterium]
MNHWSLVCSGCGRTEAQDARVGLCANCSQPFLARYDAGRPQRPTTSRWDMWRYADALPVAADEIPVSLGEGCTPLIELPALAREIGVRRVWVKDEGVNPTASFKARGLSAAVTRARANRVKGLVVPTAGNAGAALAAYGAAAQVPVRVFAPETTPRPILDIVRAMGGNVELELVPGHIGDAGRRSVAFAEETGYFNVATLREPYRVEGNKTLGIELAEQLGWRLPDVIVYPTGGGEGVVGIWKAMLEMREWGWLETNGKPARLVVAQSAGCAPLVRAWEAGSDRATPWADPVTHAAGLRVPGPLGDRLVLRALAETNGIAAAATEEEIRVSTAHLAAMSGIDAAPEGGCALAVTRKLVVEGKLAPSDEVVIFNTGSGASYRG